MSTAPVVNEPEVQHVHRDRDGIPPGIDRKMMNKRGHIRFTGEFFAAPDAGPQDFQRAVHIAWASEEILVAIDLQHRGQLYVIDRTKNFSIACRMNAEFIPEN